MHPHGNFLGAALIFLINANFIDLFNIWNSIGLYIVAEEVNSLPHVIHVHNIFSAFEVKLHFLFRHIK